MTINQNRAQGILAMLLGVFLVLFSPATLAVVKNVSIADGEGNALANTRVTIVFPDGTERKKKRTTTEH